MQGFGAYKTTRGVVPVGFQLANSRAALCANCRPAPTTLARYVRGQWLFFDGKYHAPPTESGRRYMLISLNEFGREKKHNGRGGVLGH